MIPSRPLFLGDIIGNTFVIAAKTWTRSAVASVLYLIIPATVLMMTASGFIRSMHESLDAEGYLTPKKVELFRQEAVKTLREINPLLLEVYQISEAPADTTVFASNDAATRHDAVAFAEKYDDAFSEHLFWFVIGYLLLLVASLASLVTSIDLASREFEERKLHLWRAMKETMRSYLWVNILQFLILIFVLMFGLGVATQLAMFISAEIGVLIMFAAIIMTMITMLRLLFAQPALVSENLGPFAALKRSWEITKGHGWRIVGMLVVFACIIFIVYLILSIPMSGITASSTQVIVNFLRGTEVNPTYIFDALQGLATGILISLLLTTVIFSSMSPSFLTVFYYDLRTRKDGPLVYHDEAELPESGTP